MVVWNQPQVFFNILHTKHTLYPLFSTIQSPACFSSDAADPHIFLTRIHFLSNSHFVSMLLRRPCWGLKMEVFDHWIIIWSSYIGDPPLPFPFSGLWWWGILRVGWGHSTFKGKILLHHPLKTGPSASQVLRKPQEVPCYQICQRKHVSGRSFLWLLAKYGMVLLP